MSTWNIHILHQEKNWLVIDKPAGLSVHNPEDTQNVLSVLGEQIPGKLYLAHRLDKATSGVLLLAKTSLMVSQLQAALSTAEKNYLAIIRGVPRQSSGSWTQSISNKAEGRRNPRGKAKQRIHAQTHYQVIASNPYLAKIKCRITTGRQHQIRKHCVFNGHEILGDTRYGDPRYQRKMVQRFGHFSMLLQAKTLQIIIAGKSFRFEAESIKNWDVFGL